VGKRVEHDRLPSVVIQRAAAEHLVVLRHVLRGRGALLEDVRERDALDRTLCDAIDLLRRLDADEIEDRRHQVDGMHVLVPRLALGRESCGPVDDERIAHATFVGLALPTLQRRVPGPRPTPGVVVVRVRSAELVDAGEVLLERLRDEVEEVHLVDRTARPTFGRRAVVAHHDDHGVVRLAEGVDEREEPADLCISVGEESGVHLHHAGVEPPLVG
jgi:hypothetical protein